VTTDRRVPFPLLPGWLRLLAAGVVAAFIFYASILTAPPETALDEVRLMPLDKWRHFLAYAGLGGTLAYALADADIPLRRQALGVFVFTFAYGLGVEAGQSFLPERYFSVGDAIANALGAVLAMTWYAVRPYLKLVPLAQVLK
jgi:VanZ family protein